MDEIVNLITDFGGHMKKGIVISFTGSGGVDIPLLYYSVSIFSNKGYDVERVHCKCLDKKEFEELYENIKEYIISLNLSNYEDVVFVSKSLGTYFSCKIKDELRIPARLVLYTPVEETVPYMKGDNDIILVAAGDADKFMSEDRLVSICSKENLPCLIEKGVGHSMEISNDLSKNLLVVQDVISKLQTLI